MPCFTLQSVAQYGNISSIGRVAELADAYGSGPYGRKSLRVQLPFRPFYFLVLQHEKA